MAGRLRAIDPLTAVRASCQRVCAAAREVAIDPAGIRRLAERLRTADLTPPPLDPRCHILGKGEETVAFFLTLEAINFGSGSFAEIPGRGTNGYFVVAGALAERYRQQGPVSAAELAAWTEEKGATLFSVDRNIPAAADLNRRFTAALVELGEQIQGHHGGRFTALVEAAEHSAARLVELLIAIPGFRDEAMYEDAGGSFPVALYKRAQLTAADLSLAFGGEGWGRFDDLDRLTCFADNQVPHVLRCEGVLHYGDELAGAIDTGREIRAGSRREVEIRAAAITAVELMRDEQARQGRPVTSVALDYWLWNRGLLLEYTKRPAHRTRTNFY